MMDDLPWHRAAADGLRCARLATSSGAGMKWQGKNVNDPDEMLAILKEIRDLQKQQLAEYQDQANRSNRLAEEAVGRQKALGDLYVKVVIAGGIVILLAIAYLFWIAT